MNLIFESLKTRIWRGIVLNVEKIYKETIVFFPLNLFISMMLAKLIILKTDVVLFEICLKFLRFSPKCKSFITEFRIFAIVFIRDRTQ